MITQKRLKELFIYQDGHLIWHKPTSNRVKAGDKAGASDAAGYVHVRVDGKDYLLHRLIFLLHHGWLPRFVDHKDTNPSNNRIENLRPLTHSENIANGSSTTSNTGFRGVTRAKGGKYIAQVMKNYKNHRLGTFDTPEEAHRVYLAARDMLFPGVN